jgi:AAA domain/Bifunctional DNA primase/polymerase, N-terminal/Primase C terminal 1 (PriCT-1)
MHYPNGPLDDVFHSRRGQSVVLHPTQDPEESAARAWHERQRQKEARNEALRKGRIMSNPNIAKAQELAMLGFHVVPARDKKTLPPNWPALATNDVTVIPELWQQHPGYPEVSIVTERFGNDKALVVIDVDPRNGGEATLKHFRKGHSGALEPTRVHRTPSKGLHYIYVVDQPIKQGTNVIGAGIDTRSKGGQIFFGSQYQLISGKSPAEISPLLLCHLTRSTSVAPRTEPVEVHPSAAYGEALNYLRSLKQVGEGVRNQELYKAAARLHGIGCDYDSALTLLTEHFPMSPPLEHEEVERTVRSAYVTAQNAPGSESIIACFPDLGTADHLPAPLAKGMEQQVKRERFRILNVVEFTNRPEPDWIIWHVLPQAELFILYGESTAGKSFVALDMAGAITRGVEWRGHRTKQGSVVYICAEGTGDFQLRVEAYAKDHEVTPENLSKLGLGILPDAPNLFQLDDVTALIESLRTFGKPAVIFVDTLARTSAGANENSAEDMNKVLLHCQCIHRATGALVVLIHHAGKDVSKGARGSSVIKAGADGEGEVSLLQNGNRLLRITKLKGGADGATYPFTLKRVPLRSSEHGLDIDSCVVEPAAGTGGVKRKALRGHQALVYEVVRDHVDLTGKMSVEVVMAEAVRRLAPQVDKKGQDRRPDRVRQALDAIARDKYVMVLDGEVELVGGDSVPAFTEFGEPVEPGEQGVDDLL